MASKRKLAELESESLTQIQLATRVPKDLFKTVKVFCVSNETSVSDFTTDALRHELETRQAEVAARKVKKVKVKKKARMHADDDDEPSDEDAA